MLSFGLIKLTIVFKRERMEKLLLKTLQRLPRVVGKLPSQGNVAQNNCRCLCTTSALLRKKSGFSRKGGKPEEFENEDLERMKTESPVLFRAVKYNTGNLIESFLVCPFR